MQPLFIQDGWLNPARHLPSPNFNARPADQPVRLVVMHNISLPPAQFGGGYVEAFFLNQLDHSIHPYFQTIVGVQVSAHLFVSRLGEVTQFVSFDDRAWHAGRSSYLGVPECNDYSIGIELEGTDDLPFTDAQYTALAHILPAIHAAYPSTHNHLAGHSDIAPQRKTDPGEGFDWLRVRRSIKR
jgi:AmpD protein